MMMVRHDRAVEFQTGDISIVVVLFVGLWCLLFFVLVC
jgi:hypothetical protein